jgi:hypothetical protein
MAAKKTAPSTRNVRNTTPARNVPATPATAKRNPDDRTVGVRNMPASAINTKFTRGGPDAARAQRGRPELPEGRFKVRALLPGFYNNKRRRVGDVFVIEGAQAFSVRWMEVVDNRTPTRTTTAKEHLKREHDAILEKTQGGRVPLEREESADDDEAEIFGE